MQKMVIGPLFKKSDFYKRARRDSNDMVALFESLNHDGERFAITKMPIQP